MLDTLKKTKLPGGAGTPAWLWRDPNGRKWYIYKSFSMWRYIREDHDVSSIGYLTLADASKALLASFSPRAGEGRHE